MNKIIEKLDAIEAQNNAQIVKATKAVATKLQSVKEELTTEFAEKVAAIEAKVSQINGAPSILRLEKTVRGNVNKMVKEQLKAYYKEGRGKKN